MMQPNQHTRTQFLKKAILVQIVNEDKEISLLFHLDLSSELRTESWVNAE